MSWADVGVSTDAICIRIVLRIIWTDVFSVGYSVRICIRNHRSFGTFSRGCDCRVIKSIDNPEGLRLTR